MKLFLPFIGLFLLVQSATAQTAYTWNGSVSTSWNVAGNWTPNGIPGTLDNVTIVTATNNCHLAANASISNITLTSGTLDLGGFTLTAGGNTVQFSTGTVQNGTITVSAATSTVFGNGPVTMNCVTNITSGAITFKNTTFQGATSITKTGTSNDASSGGNTFNGAAVFTNAGAGYLLLGNGSADQFNSSATFNNTGSNNLYVAYNSSGNVFNGTTAFNNSTTTNNVIYVSQNSSSTTFNDSIVVTSTSGAGVQFGSGTSATTLAAGQTISIGPAGFSAGTLLLKAFTQTGATSQNIQLTGTADLTFGPSSTFNGNVTATSPTFFLNGCTFNDTTNLTKTGTTGDYCTGGNTFNTICNITNSGSNFWVLGNSNPDIWNSDVTFTDNGSERLLPCWSATGNQFNGNINVNTLGSALGIEFCGGNNTATATLATGKTIQAGSNGLTAGFLYLKQFIQTGSTAINLTATGNSVVYLGPSSSFGGTVNITAPDIWAQGATYNSAATFTKTGGTSNHNNQYQNIFNSTCTINQQSSTGYFMLGYNSNDLFNNNIIVTSTGTGGIYLGWTSGTGTPTLAAGKTIQVGSAGFSAGFLNLNTFTQQGTAPINLAFTGSNTYLTFARNSVIGGYLTTSTPDIYFNGCTFNGNVNATKTGASGDGSVGGNVFQDSTVINITGAGYITLGNTTADTWNNYVSFNASGSSVLGVAWGSAGNTFNGNIAVSSTGSATGVQFCGGNTTATATLASGYSIVTGPAGFSSGNLQLRQFTQLGSAPTNITLTGATTILQMGPSSTIGGNFTVVSPRFQLQTTVFSDSVSLTKTGSTGEWCYGGNTFNSTLTVNQQGSGYFGFANGAPDIYNGDVYANNNSTERIIFGNNPAGNQFNGNIILTQIGSSVGIAFGWGATTNETMAAGKTISIGAAGFSTGYLQIERFTQSGSTPMNLPLTGTSSLTFGPASTVGGNLTTTSGSLFFNGCTFMGSVNSIKTGSASDNNSGGNIFNGVTTITDAGAGYLLLGGTNPDQFNDTTTFNNTGSNNMYVAYNSANNVFGGMTTFNNSPTANVAINVSPYSTGTVFNGNIVVSSTSGVGIQFCSGNATATATLAAGNTISVGSGGFSAGTLLLRQFTQVGATVQSLTLTGTGILTFGPLSSIGGDIATVSPTLFFNGCTFGGMVNATKNGTTSDQSTGNNIFDGPFAVTNTGSGYFLMGSANPDLWQSTATFNNMSSASHMYVAWNSSGNTFNGDVTFNNMPGATGLWIYSNTNGSNTVFNGNIFVNNIGGAGVYFGQGATGSATLAGSGSISAGSAGFTSGSLIFQNFTQSNAGSAQNITLTGTAIIQYGTNATFNGPVTSSSPGVVFNSSTFNGTVTATKTGTSNDNSTGNNTFNGVSAFTDNGTGNLTLSNSGPDAYNANTSFVQSNTGKVQPDYNYNGTYAANVTVTSPAATAITFGAGAGTATFAGTAAQTISATAGTPAPIFARLVINNGGGGVTLTNTSISVSNNLVMSAGLLNTTTSYLLIMLNGSTTAAGNVLSTSYVNGPMQYQKSSTGVSTLNFPIGSGPDCRPIVLTINHSSSTLYTYTAQLFDASAAALSYTLPPSVDQVSGVHYYTITRANSAGVNTPATGLSGNQMIQVFFGANDIVSNGGTLTIVKNVYTAPTTWINIGGAGGPVYNAGADLTGSITSTSSPTAFNSFSTFALADQIGGGNVLPIGLLYFNALPGGSHVDLQWATTTESNNSYFTIERSKDGVSFTDMQQVATEAPGGNSSVQLDYSAQDLSPYTGVSYYRLRQTDLNGNSTYSNIVSVNFAGSSAISVYPNPARDVLYVTGLDVNINSLQAVWYDISGRQLLQSSVAVSGGTASLAVGLKNGYYVVKLMASDGSYTVHNIIIMK